MESLERSLSGLPPDPPYYSPRKPRNQLDGSTHQQMVPIPDITSVMIVHYECKIQTS